MSPTPIVGFDEKIIAGMGGARLFLRSAQLDQKAHAAVLLTHGLGEHSGRYAHVAAAMAARGLRLCAYDLRGHGRSSGRRGDARSYSDLLEDLDCAKKHFETRERPLFLMGHSLGGQITLSYLLSRGEGIRCSGAVVASPWLRLAFAPSPWRLALARLAVNIWPAMRQRTPQDWTKLSRDGAHLASLPEAHLCYGRISARLFLAIENAGRAAAAAAGDLLTPLLLVHGGNDPVTSAAATRNFHECAGSADRTLLNYPNARHETLNDLCRDQVIADIIAWIEARVAV